MFRSAFFCVKRCCSEAILKRFANQDLCSLIVTTGGTGPSPRNITHEATEAARERILPKFGELMRSGTSPPPSYPAKPPTPATLASSSIYPASPRPSLSAKT